MAIISGSPTCTPISGDAFPLQSTCSATANIVDPGTYCWDVTVTDSSGNYAPAVVDHLGINNQATECFTIAGQEGCTPGFWKNNAANWNYSAWPAGTFEDVPFDDIFDRVITINEGKKGEQSDPTLEQALAAKGGDINALARHGTAAYLNSVDIEVNFGLSPAQVISLVQEGIDNPEKTNENKNILAAENERGCSQNQFGEPSEE